jgi:hypothetical protein
MKRIWWMSAIAVSVLLGCQKGPETRVGAGGTPASSSVPDSSVVPSTGTVHISTSPYVVIPDTGTYTVPGSSSPYTVPGSSSPYTVPPSSGTY